MQCTRPLRAITTVIKKKKANSYTVHQRLLLLNNKKRAVRPKSLRLNKITSRISIFKKISTILLSSVAVVPFSAEHCKE